MKTKLKSILAAALCAVGLSAWATPQKLGDSNTTWELTANNTVLTIGGTGPMPGWSNGNLSARPWNNARTMITTVKIGTDVTEIGTNAFCNCSKLTSVSIPSSVTSIGETAFGQCGELARVVFKSNTPPTLIFNISRSPFYRASSSLKLYVPQGRKTTYENADANTWGQVASMLDEAYVVDIKGAAHGSLVMDRDYIPCSEFSTANKTMTVTPMPDPGYQLKSLVYNDGTNHDITNTKSFTMPSKNVTLTAVFEEVKEVTLPMTMGYEFAVSNLTAGALAEILPTVSGGLTYALPIGAKVGIYAVPEKGFVVKDTPYIINEVKSDTAIDAGKLPTAQWTVTIANVTTATHWPWDGKIDVTCDLTGVGKVTLGAALTTNGVTVCTATAANLTGETVIDLDAVQGVTNGVMFVWAAQADCPADFNAADTKVKVTAEKFLPAGLLWKNGPIWADRNVGANEPWEYGYYFWWGDTVGYTNANSSGGSQWVSVDGKGAIIKFSKLDATAKQTYGKDVDTLVKEQWIDGSGNLVVSDDETNRDAARAHCGGSWRMPTADECAKLGDPTVCQLTLVDNYKDTGVRGYVVRGKKGTPYANNEVFFPNADDVVDPLLPQLGSYGCYWSSTPSSDDSDVAWGQIFDLGRSYRFDFGRYFGLSVRPVRGSAE